MKRVRLTWIAYAIMICSLTSFAQPDTVWTRELRYDPISDGHWIIDIHLLINFWISDMSYYFFDLLAIEN